VARIIDLLIPGRSGEALEVARQDSERRLAELRAQSRRLRRVIQKLHEEDRRREHK
jgi:hypothetical protein